MDVEASFSPDYKGRGGHLLFDWQLSLDPLLDLGRIPTASEQSCLLTGRRTSDADGRVQLLIGVGFEQERYNDDREAVTFLLPGPDLSAPEFTNTWMEHMFQPLAQRRVGKNSASELISTQLAVVPNNLGPENGLDFCQGRLAGFDHAPSQVIGIDDRNIPPAQEFGTSGFAHANTTRQTDSLHGDVGP